VLVIAVGVGDGEEVTGVEDVGTVGTGVGATVTGVGMMVLMAGAVRVGIAERCLLELEKSWQGRMWDSKALLLAQNKTYVCSQHASGFVTV